jgi:hypothetical protein
MPFPNLPYKGDQIPNQPFNTPETPATFDRLFGSLVPNIQLEPNPSDIAPPPSFGNQWIRPEDWLPLPTVNDTDEKFVGLFAVFNTPENFIALQCEGNYIVDWGDGVVENISSGVKAQHSYDWASISETTLTTRGYKQVLVTVTPQEGQVLSSFRLSPRHDNVSEYYASAPWLDLLMSLPNADVNDSIVLDGTYHESNESEINNVERVQILNSGNATDFSGMFYYAQSLQEFLLGKSVAENASNMFSECLALNTVRFQNMTSLSFIYDAIDSFPYYVCNGLNVYLENITDVTDASYAFSGLSAIKNVFINNMPDTTDMSNMFNDCEYLENAYIQNIPNVTTLYEAFEYNYSLKSATIGNCPALEDTGYMFYDCEFLERVTFGNTPSLQYTYQMFEYCYALFEVPALDMTNVVDAESMFYNCGALRKVPDYNTASLISAYEMFSYCYSLSEAPNINLSGVNDIDYMFYTCPSLNKIPAYDLTACSNLSSAFEYCPILQEAPITNVSTNVSFYNCLMAKDAIVDIFNGLSTVAPESETINVAGNYGVADLTGEDIAIATGKGWVVIS